MNEIILANYNEHIKFAKELAMIYEIKHPKRDKIEKSINDIIKKHIKKK